MNGFFFIVTLIAGFFVELLFHHYLGLFGVAPNLLLLFVLAAAFMLGPLSGELLGFCWGLMADAMGVQLFGLNAFLLTFMGYIAGKLKRRFDAERPAPQVIIACIATVCNAFIASMIYGITEEPQNRVRWSALLLEIIMNGFLAAGVFWVVDRWLDLWRIERDQV